MPITQMEEAQRCYDQAMQSLAVAHDRLNAISGATPVDWIAYQAALSSCNALQNAARDAETLFEATILDTPDVTALRQTLAEATARMKARTDGLTASAGALDALASSANDADAILTTLSACV